MNVSFQKETIKRPMLNVVDRKGISVIDAFHQSGGIIVKKTATHCLQLIMNVSLYFPVTFVWLTVAFMLSGNLSITYPFEPEAMFLTPDKVVDLLAPVFRLSLAVTLILCLLRQTIGIFQRKSNRKESTSCLGIAYCLSVALCCSLVVRV